MFTKEEREAFYKSCKEREDEMKCFLIFWDFWFSLKNNYKNNYIYEIDRKLKQLKEDKKQ